MGNGLSVIPILPADLGHWFKRLEWHFGSFADRSQGGRSVETILRSILDAETQCWAVTDGEEVCACALTYVATDDAKTCVVLACAGSNYKRWAGLLLNTLDAWRREAGCLKMEVHARPGWEKFLRGEGMKKTHVIMEMPNVRG
jgi:hypothetical protein